MSEPMSPETKRKYWGIALIVIAVLGPALHQSTTVIDAIKGATGSMMAFIGGVALLMSSRK